MGKMFPIKKWINLRNISFIKFILINLEMSILNLEVKIRKIKIKTSQNNGVCFSLRLGRILSSLSSIITNQADQEIETNIDVTIGCEESVLASNSRASLVIYEALPDQKRQIVGMVFIMLKNQQFQVQRYKIQQSSDPDSFIQLSFSITTIQLKQKQNESMASKSSLAEIRQLHRALSRGHKKSISDISYQGDQLKKSRLSPQDKQRELRHINSNKITHLKSQESCPFANDEDPSYAVIMKKLQHELTKERQRNSILTNLLVVEEQKNTESENYIKKIIGYLQNYEKADQLDNTFSQEEKQNGTLKIEVPQQGENKKRQSIESNKQDMYSSTNMETILKQRDQLYKISHQLYEKTKLYKIENQQLFKNTKSLQNELKLCLQEVKELRKQNIEVKNQLFQLSDKKQSMNYHQMKEQNEKLRSENAEYERKFKESFRAIEQFKKDAWQAQEQVLKKDQQIAALKEDLELTKNMNEGHPARHLHHQNNSIEMQIDQRQTAKMALQTFKLMSALLLKNSLEREKILQKLSENKQQLRNTFEESKLIQKVKESIERVYQNFLKQSKKMIHILEMKRKITEALNTINF